MAAVIASATPVRSRPAPVDPSAGRPPLRLLEGGRRGVRAEARAQAQLRARSVEVRSARPSPAVYRRRRLAVATVAIVAIGITFLSFVGLRALLADPVPAAGAASAAATPSGTLHARYYVVQPGDTLWSIARALHPRGDLRPLVDRLEQRAGGGTLMAGTRLRVDGLGG
jgi:hypothetical protein